VLKLRDLKFVPKGPLTQPITYESHTTHPQIGFVRACVLRNCQKFGMLGVDITDESRNLSAYEISSQ